MKTVSYNKTKVACYLGYITQAISINLLPLLYVIFQDQFSVSLTQLGLLATIVFVVQIAVDLLAARFGKRISYRVGCVAAHVFASVGLILMSFLPSVLPNPYVGVLLAALLLSVGGGLIEVLISPVVDAIPGDSKAGDMSLLHSFYCWGVVAVALLSTAFFALFGAVAWRWLALLWSAVPAMTAWLFIVVPLPTKPEDTAQQHNSSLTIVWSSLFCVLMLLMLCAGATELGLAQWASLFAERGLRVTKTAGDLLGPCAFALFQGTARVIYARLTVRYDDCRVLILHAVGCVCGYGAIVLSPWPFVSLLGFCLCGWCVGPMWPGILSLASARYPMGGTSMFAILALCGDMGCSLAPALVGAVSEQLQTSVSVANALRGGFGVCTAFPSVLLVGLLLLRKRRA